MTVGGTTDVIVLCGALGSGKTTLLTDYLRRPEAADTAVIVNEVGAISVDGALVSAGRPGLEMATLSNGCVCCSLGNDLGRTVEGLLAAGREAGRPFRRVVLETSGLARPGPVVRSLSELPHLGLAVRIVTTYDCRADWLARPDTAAEATAQLAAAHTVALTKAELVDADARRRMAGRVGRLNPFARLVTEADRAGRAAGAFAPAGGTPPVLPRMTDADAHPDVLVLTLRWPEPVDWVTVEDWLEELAGFCGRRLLRAKGFLAVAGCAERVLVQGVGTVFDTPRRIATDAEPPDGLVVIMRDLDVGTFRRFLEDTPGSPALAARARADATG